MDWRQLHQWSAEVGLIPERGLWAKMMRIKECLENLMLQVGDARNSAVDQILVTSGFVTVDTVR